MKKFFTLIASAILVATSAMAEVTKTTYDFTNTTTWTTEKIATGSAVTLNENAEEDANACVTFNFTKADATADPVVYAGGQIRVNHGKNTMFCWYAAGSATTENVTVVVKPNFYVAISGVICSSTRPLYYSLDGGTTTKSITSSQDITYYNSGTENVIITMWTTNSAKSSTDLYTCLKGITLSDCTNATKTKCTVNAVATIDGVKTVIKTQDYTDLVEGVPFTVSSWKAIKHTDDKYYELENSSTMTDFSNTFTKGDVAETKEFNYILAEDIAYYAEGEGKSQISGTTSDVTSSGGQYGTYVVYNNTKYVNLGELATDTYYQLEINVKNRPNNYATNLYAHTTDGNSLLKTMPTTSSIGLKISDAFTYESSYTLYAQPNGGNGIGPDYLLVRQLYNISIGSFEHGTVTADKSSNLSKGTIVTLTATPETNYVFDAFSVKDENDNDISVNADNTFTMPASTVTITATFKQILNWTAKTSTGLSLGSGTCVQGDAVTVAYPYYVNVNGTLFSKGNTNKEYRVSFTPDKDNYEYTVNYTATEISNVVYLAEGENITGATACSASSTNMAIRSSNANCGYAASDLTLKNLSAGVYKAISVIYANNASSSMSINYKVGSNEFTNENKDAEGKTYASNWITCTNEFTLTEAADFKWLASGNYKNGLDFIYIQKIGDILSAGSNGYTTYSNATNNFVVSGADAYYAPNAASDSKVVLGKITEGQVIPTNQGVILKANNAGDEITVSLIAADATELTGNHLVAVTSESQTVADGTNYVLATSNGTTSFYSFTSNSWTNTLNSALVGKCYLNVPTQSGEGSGAKSLTISFEDDVTGISQIENGELKVENSVRKYIENGRLVINKNGKMYNAAGALLK